MINFLALSLVFTSLLASQVWSPNAHQNQKKDDVIIKQGHRVIVVESYDQDGHHNTKVSISPAQDPISDDVDVKFPSGFVDNAKDKIKQGVSSVFEPARKLIDGKEGGRSTGELIGDAIDTSPCMNSMSEALHKAIDVPETGKKEAASSKVKEKGEHAYGKAKEKAHEAKEAVENTYGKLSEKTSDTIHGARERLVNTYGKTTNKKAPSTAHRAKEAAEDIYDKTKDFATRKAQDVKDTTSQSVKQVKKTAKTTKEMAKTSRCDAFSNVSKQVGNLKNSTEQAANSVFKALKDGIRFLRSVKLLNALFGTVNVLGFAMAYGMGMWVAFISSHVLAGSLPRHQFGLVQSKMYPVYFRAMGLSIITALIGHILGHMPLIAGGRAERLQIFNLLAALLAVSVNAFYLEPSATKVMFEKFKLEKEEGRGREMEAHESSRAEAAAGIAETVGVTEAASAAVTAEEEEQEQREIREKLTRMNNRLKRLNSLSAFLNILTLMGLSWHLVDLGHCVHGTC